jgi:hypothetical protein
MSTTYVYRVLKSAWGIRVSVTASSTVKPPVQGLNSAARGGVAVNFAKMAVGLPDVLKDQVRKGLAHIASDIVASCDGKDLLVTVEEVDFNEADFQAEGLSVAMIRWAEQEFKLPVHEVEVSFDREKNRYFFKFA